MSSSSITDPAMLAWLTDSWSLPQAVVRLVKQLAFWTAVVLPFLYLPLLVTGLESQSGILVVALLVVLNVFALLVGHPYGAE